MATTCDTPVWSKEFYDHKARWIHYFHQIKMVRNRIRTFPGDRAAFSVLEVGPVHGVVGDYLKKFGVRVTTLDIRKEYKPDVVASVAAMPFPDDSFDMILVCEVLEHLSSGEFARALKELRRVTRGAVLVSLPDARLTLLAFTFQLPFTGERQMVVKLPNLVRAPRHDGHRFELGRPGYSLGRMRRIVRDAGFRIALERCYAQTPKNYYFLLEKE